MWRNLVSLRADYKAIENLVCRDVGWAFALPFPPLVRLVPADYFELNCWICDL